MKNEQAIYLLKGMRGKAIQSESEAINMAIEALEVGHAQCNDCHYRYHWVTQRMNGQNGGATA